VAFAAKGLMMKHEIYCKAFNRTDSVQGRRKQPGDGPAKLSTIPRITGTQASPPSQEIFEN